MPASLFFVAVGSNIDPDRHIPAALEALQASLTVLGSSTFCRTEPVGPAGQPPFVNGAWCCRTDRAAGAVRDLLHRIETTLGRVRTPNRYAPRPIDLDLILQTDRQGRPIPTCPIHPDIERCFVAGPILELAGTLALPGLPAGCPALRRCPAEPWGLPHPTLTRALQAKIP